MDMSLEDTLAALGLDDEVTVSPRTGRDGGGNFFIIPSGWSRSHTEDSKLTTGQTPFAPGTPESFVDTLAGRVPHQHSQKGTWEDTAILEPQSKNWREHCRNGRLCSLTSLRVLLPPRAAAEVSIPTACYKCGEVGHYCGIAPVIRRPRRQETQWGGKGRKGPPLAE